MLRIADLGLSAASQAMARNQMPRPACLELLVQLRLTGPPVSSRTVRPSYQIKMHDLPQKTDATDIQPSRIQYDLFPLIPTVLIGDCGLRTTPRQHTSRKGH